MRDKDDLDLLLDAALSTYADPGVDSGLEARILARVTNSQNSVESETAPRRRWMPWVFALPAAACLLLFFTVPKTPHAPSGQAPQMQRSELHPSVIAHSDPSATFLTAQPRRARTPARAAQYKPAQLIASAVARPKLGVFPTPRPLTPQEQALVVFATRTPEQQRETVVEAQKQDNEPLSIAAIHIPPIEPPEEGKN